MGLFGSKGAHFGLIFEVFKANTVITARWFNEQKIYSIKPCKTIRDTQ